MIVDFHTHIFPDALAHRAVAVLERNIVEKSGVPIYAQTDGTADGLRASMAEAGVDLSVVLPVATTVTQHESINRFAESVRERGLLSFAAVHPLQPDWERTLEDIAARGFLGIKLHPDYQETFIDAPEALRVLKKAVSLGLLVSIHAGWDAGSPPPTHCTPERLYHVLQEVPGDRLIAAHMGGFNEWDGVEKLLVGTELYLDTAVVGGFIPPAQYKRMIENHGADRVLFASDSPWESQRHALEHLRSLGLDKAAEDQILGGNACRLLGLSEET